MEVQSALKEISDQWLILLAARMCNSLQLSDKDLKSRLDSVTSRMTNTDMANILRQGYRMSTTNTPEQIIIMNETVGCLLMQFHNHQNFCKLFGSLITATHEMLNTPLQTELPQKAKALHTDQIVNEEVLSEFTKFECSAFHYLSTFLLAAAKCPEISFDPINLDIVSIIFHYLKHDQPNAVRASAGDILSALSSSPRHCQMIIDMFWQQFGLCKKDDDFRNFASWIDGVQKLQLGLTPEPLEKVSLQFFQKMIDNEKKIERGVLRMKFLDSLISMMKTINKSPLAATHEKYISLQNQIWDIAYKWSSKGKHTSFCYAFLCKMLAISSPNFYIDKHGNQFCEWITKYAKNGEIDMLKLLVDFIHETPEEFYKSHFDEFTKIIKNYIMPLLFTGNEKKRSLRFTQHEQVQAVLQIMTELGKKQLMTIVDFTREVLSVEEPNSDHKRVRLLCIQTISNIASSNPEELGKYNEQLFPLLENSILQTNPELKDESQYAIPTFPLIHSMNEEKLNQLADIIYNLSLEDSTIGNNAMTSLSKFLETIVTFNMCAKAPVIYIQKLLEHLQKATDADLIHYILYLTTLISSYSSSLDHCENISDQVKNSSKFSVDEWNKMRMNLDVVLVKYVFSTNKTVSQNTNSVFKVITSPKLQELDRACGYSTAFDNYVAGLEANSDILTHLSAFVEQDLVMSQNLFANVLTMWEQERRSFEAQHSSKIMQFLSLIIRENKEPFKKYIGDLFQLLVENPSNVDAIHAISLIDFSLAADVAGLIDPWTKQTHREASFQPQTTTIMHSIASRESFTPALQTSSQLAKLFEQYIIQVQSIQAPNSQEEFNNLEKALKVITIFAKSNPQHLENILNNDEQSTKFISTLFTFAKIESCKFFTNTYPETFIVCIKTVFEYAKFPESIQKSFTVWLSQFIRRYESKEQIQVYIVQMLTVILEHNTNLLYYFLTLSYTKADIIASHAILAIANVFTLRDDFLEQYPNGSAILLVTVVLHISSVNVLSRQAAHKLLCLLLTKEHTIFTKTAPRTLVMAMTSHTPSGFITQASHFINFASQSVTPEVARSFFTVFADDLGKLEQPQNPILNSIFSFVNVILDNCVPAEVVTTALKLTTHCKLDEASTAAAVTRLWQSIFEIFKNKNDSQVAKDIIELVFNYGLEKDNLKSIETQISIIVIVSLFQIFPQETSSFLLPILTIFDTHLPEGVDDFLHFIGGADFTFEPTPKEILAANALSQILLLISDRTLFTELFSSKLPALLFFAIMNYHIDEFIIGNFRPLLDTLLDAGLFRFAENNKMFSQNLASLQEANLIGCATSLEQQFLIITVPPAKKMLAYDNEAVLTMTSLMCQNDPEFKREFFNIVLANAVQVKNPDRCIELLIMMIALKDEMTTKSIYYLLLFTLYALKNNRSELMDALVDNIHHRLISDKCDSEAFSREAVPVVIIFLLYISIDYKRSFSMHLIRILTDVCKKIAESDIAEAASKELNDFFAKWNGDEYIASLFVRYVADLQTLGDENCKYVIECLYRLSKLISVSGTHYNWCLLLALLIDFTRASIAEMSERPIPSILIPLIEDLKYKPVYEFAEFLGANFTDDRFKNFILMFPLALYKSFKCLDIHKDEVAMNLLNEYLTSAKPHLTPGLSDSIIKTVSLVNLTSDADGREAASSVLYQIISNIKYKVGESTMSITAMNPQITPVTRKVIGYYVSQKGFAVKQEIFPKVQLFMVGSIETQAIIDMMWDYIVDKVNNNQ